MVCLFWSCTFILGPNSGGRHHPSQLDWCSYWCAGHILWHYSNQSCSIGESATKLIVFHYALSSWQQKPVPELCLTDMGILYFFFQFSTEWIWWTVASVFKTWANFSCHCNDAFDQTIDKLNMVFWICVVVLGVITLCNPGYVTFSGIISLKQFTMLDWVLMQLICFPTMAFPGFGFALSSVLAKFAEVQMIVLLIRS
jgi:hypothetical protein